MPKIEMRDSVSARHDSPAKEPHFSLRAGVEASMLAGALFLLLEYLSAVLLGADSPLGPARVTLRSMLNLGPDSATEPYLITVLFVHFGLSILTTCVLGYFIHRVVRYWAVTFGVVYGLLLYTINFFVFAFWLPDISAANDLFMFTNYMIYGGVAAWLYKWRAANIRR